MLPVMRLPTSPIVFAALLCASALPAQGVAIPYFESFESPTWPGAEWTRTYSNAAFGRILALAPSTVSPDGGLAASFDVTTSSNVSTNELTLAVDLAATPGAMLEYWAKETADETDVEDGLFINDGVALTWVKVVDHATLTSTWVGITVNLASVATANGLSVTSNFKIRFSQRDNFPTPTDGVQIDGIRITEPLTGQPNSAAAALDVNASAAGAGVNGPFFATASPGGLLVFTVQGAPNVPYILAAGPLLMNNAVIPGVGSLDVGQLGGANLSDVVIVLDGTQPGFLNSLAHTDAAGGSVLTFSMPPAPAGPWLAFQAALVDGPTITLSAATLVTVP